MDARAQNETLFADLPTQQRRIAGGGPVLAVKDSAGSRRELACRATVSDTIRASEVASTSRRQKLDGRGLSNCLVHLVRGHEDNYFTRYKATSICDH
jgi:hypothetical protein